MNKKIISMMLVLALLISMVLSILIYNDKSTITGNDVLTRVEIIPAQPQDCNFNMTYGWNFISIYCLGAWVPLSEGLESIERKYESIFTYSASDSADPWKSYNPSLPSQYVQQLQYMDRVNAYWVNVNSSSGYAEYFYSGFLRNALIPIRPGWNMVGYVKNDSLAINQSNLQLSIVKEYDESLGDYLIYINGSSGNTLIEFNKYEGYWINSTAVQTWNVN